jgi:phospholipase C
VVISIVRAGHDMAKGERLLKDIYEALRAGPGWENTLFAIAYDDAGDFYGENAARFSSTSSCDADFSAAKMLFPAFQIT